MEQEEFRPGRLGKLQKILWDLFEKPHTSLGARVSEREYSAASLQGFCFFLPGGSIFSLFNL